MKTVLFITIIISLSFSSCNIRKNKGSNQKNTIKGYGQPSVLLTGKTHDYLLYKVDSVNTYYTLYLEYNSLPYKVISPKLGDNTCNKMKIGHYYFLRLRSYGLNVGVQQDTSKMAINYHEFNNCIEFDDSTTICKERYMDDLYYCNEIKGLCKE